MDKKLQIIKEEFLELNDGIKKAKHDYHSFVLSTIRNNVPDSRTVILRSFDDKLNSISFHSDIRSSKINDIQTNHHVSALFYSKLRKTQLRISGTATIEKEEKGIEKIWKAMTPESKICYMGPYSPSKKITSYKPNLPDITPYEINEDYEKLGYKNFCRIKITFKYLDILKLSYKGHQRISYTFEEKIESVWIAP
jgi:pyridoxamine 5'-phosphate oxidase